MVDEERGLRSRDSDTSFDWAIINKCITSCVDIDSYILLNYEPRIWQQIELVRLDSLSHCRNESISSSRSNAYSSRVEYREGII